MPYGIPMLPPIHVPPIHVVSNNVDTDKLTTANGGRSAIDKVHDSQGLGLGLG